jgi:hypothetical protein
MEVVMKKALSILLSALLLVVFVSTLLAADAKYVGANKCKMCHISAKRGAQYKTWQAGPHAGAYETLASPESKEIAKKMGIADAQKSDKCLKCHVTAHGVDASLKNASYKVEEGVGCESCHGPGSEYKSMKVMKALAAGTQDAKAVAYQKGSKETCLKCHNEESPTYKQFNYDEKWKKIAHPVPAK